MPLSRLPILTYHSLDESGSVISVAPALFARQMDRLAAAGYQTLALAEALALLSAGRPFPERRVVLTFDDGYRNVYTHGFPVLQRHGFTATVFLIPDYCGGHNDWPSQPPTVARRPLMSWSEIGELHRHGFEMGAHTLTHPDLTRLSAQAAEQEVGQSKAEIEDRLGTAVTTFAYPYGACDAAAQAAARRHFAGACGTRLGKMHPKSDAYALERVDMYYFKNATLFDALPGRLITPYLKARQVLRDVKTLWAR